MVESRKKRKVEGPTNTDGDHRNVEIEVIDYSRIAFRSFLPPYRKGKFIQVADGETEYVVLAPYELATHHAVILERFCMQHEVKGIWARKPSVFRILDGEWEVLGGGHFVIDDEERSLRLFGESTSYGSFDRDGLKGKLATVPALQGYSLRIGRKEIPLSNTDPPRLKTVPEILEEEADKLIASLLREAKKVTTAEEIEVARKAKRRSGSKKVER